MNIEVMTALLTALASLGGVELVKWLYTRRSSQRSARARAAADEFKPLREYTEFLQSSVRQAEERYQEQTQHVRRLNQELVKLAGECRQASQELQLKRCEVAACPRRQPATGF